MHPEDLPDPGTYVDPETGDIWEKLFSGKWYVNGMLHKPFPHSLTPEQHERNHPAVTIDDVVKAALENKKLEAELVAQYEEWRPVVGYPRYEVNRNGDLRYVETGVQMAPSMGDASDTYYPLLDSDNVVHLTSLGHILDQTFPESRD